MLHRPAGIESGVIHEHVDGAEALLGSLKQSRDAFQVGHIGRDGKSAILVVDGIADFGERLGVARDQDNVSPFGRELPGRSGSDARGGIRVSTVSPGPVDTEFIRPHLDEIPDLGFP